MSDTELGTNIEPEIKIRKAKPQGVPDTVRIVIEENDDIPPTGLFVGHNDKAFLIRAGEPVDVPRYVVDILDNAITSLPQIDPSTRQVVGHRDRMRYPYRVIS